MLIRRNGHVGIPRLILVNKDKGDPVAIAEQSVSCEVQSGCVEICIQPLSTTGLREREHAIVFRACRVGAVFVIADGRIRADKAKLVHTRFDIYASSISRRESEHVVENPK